MNNLLATPAQELSRLIYVTLLLLFIGAGLHFGFSYHTMALGVILSQASLFTVAVLTKAMKEGE